MFWVRFKFWTDLFSFPQIETCGANRQPLRSAAALFQNENIGSLNKLKPVRHISLGAFKVRSGFWSNKVLPREPLAPWARVPAVHVPVCSWPFNTKPHNKSGSGATRECVRAWLRGARGRVAALPWNLFHINVWSGPKWRFWVVSTLIWTRLMCGSRALCLTAAYISAGWTHTHQHTHTHTSTHSHFSWQSGSSGFLITLRLFSQKAAWIRYLYIFLESDSKYFYFILNICSQQHKQTHTLLYTLHTHTHLLLLTADTFTWIH